jgi:N-acetylmuramoyl-L-alanine amidase
MRQIKEIIIHCSATPEGRNWTIKDIERDHKSKGYKKVCYHYVICLDGTIEKGRAESEVGAHCKGHNAKSIGICYVGGLDKNRRPKDTRTEAQRASMKRLVEELQERYPEAGIHGHNEFANKACPCFDVTKM